MAPCHDNRKKRLKRQKHEVARRICRILHRIGIYMAFHQKRVVGITSTKHAVVLEWIHPASEELCTTRIDGFNNLDRLEQVWQAEGVKQPGGNMLYYDDMQRVIRGYSVPIHGIPRDGEIDPDGRYWFAGCIS